MKYLITGDYHIFQPLGLESVIEKEAPDILISLGDFDWVGQAEDFLRIRGRVKERIEVAGNHDHAIFNNIEIEAPVLEDVTKRTGKTWTIKDVHEELMKNEAVREYFAGLLKPENLVKKFQIGDFRAVVVHGAYYGSFQTAPIELREPYFNLWYRIIEEPPFILPNLMGNFSIMKANGENLMIRGHDHFAFHGCVKDGITSYQFNPEKIEMESSSMHIISPGPFYDGNYAVLEVLSKSRIKASFRVFNHYLVAKK